jgi:hypothetical protein
LTVAIRTAGGTNMITDIYGVQMIVQQVKQLYQQIYTSLSAEQQVLVPFFTPEEILTIQAIYPQIKPNYQVFANTPLTDNDQSLSAEALLIQATNRNRYIKEASAESTEPVKPKNDIVPVEKVAAAADTWLRLLGSMKYSVFIRITRVQIMLGYLNAQFTDDTPMVDLLGIKIRSSLLEILREYAQLYVCNPFLRITHNDKVVVCQGQMNNEIHLLVDAQMASLITHNDELYCIDQPEVENFHFDFKTQQLMFKNIGDISTVEQPQYTDHTYRVHSIQNNVRRFKVYDLSKYLPSYIQSYNASLKPAFADLAISECSHYTPLYTRMNSLLRTPQRIATVFLTLLVNTTIAKYDSLRHISSDYKIDYEHDWKVLI